MLRVQDSFDVPNLPNRTLFLPACLTLSPPILESRRPYYYSDLSTSQGVQDSLHVPGLPNKTLFVSVPV
ncbi:hypothetical protein J6590_099447 [Homalodisca vitripennis]|nr:hypothetical protein J6590_099447 [Homalodisca vitripennis]